MVVNRWDQAEANIRQEACGDDLADQQLSLQAYASRLIGGDAALVQHGGGNTSCKLTRKDLFGRDVPVLHIKGSGCDLAQITPEKMPAVRLDRLLELRSLARLGDAEMVNTLRLNMLDAGGPTPSVEILLHAFLPHEFVNHTHATAMLALANLPDAAAVTRDGRRRRRHPRIPEGGVPPWPGRLAGTKPAPGPVPGLALGSAPRRVAPQSAPVPALAEPARRWH